MRTVVCLRNLRPNFDADCTEQSGWYRLESSAALIPYEWNTVALHFGVGGFGVDLNGTEVGSCSVLARPLAPFPRGLPRRQPFESMLGYVDNLEASFSLTDSKPCLGHCSL